MATATPLHHPQEAAQNEQYFRFRAKFGTRKSGAWVDESGLDDLKGAYKPDISSSDATAMFQKEMPDVDTLLILGWYPQIKKGLRCLLTWPDGVTKREFIVQDAASGNSGPTRTMVALVPPKTAQG